MSPMIFFVKLCLKCGLTVADDDDRVMPVSKNSCQPDPLLHKDIICRRIVFADGGHHRKSHHRSHVDKSKV